MKKYLKIFLLLGFLSAVQPLLAQNTSDMRINEFLVVNVDDFEDDFGHKNSWIELFNTSYGTVDIGGCYFTNDPDNLTKYLIPRGDVLTKIKPRQHILFWADNRTMNGTFHLNFTLEESKEILFVSNDGRTVIDRIKIPDQIPGPDISYGRFRDGEDVMKIDDKKVVDIAKTWGIMESTSPSTNNFGAYAVSAGMVLLNIDPFGIIMSLTAMTVVFLSLILLYLVFKRIGKYNMQQSHKKSTKETAPHGKVAAISDDPDNAEVYAAIAAAIHAYNHDEENHDVEETILTIQKVTRNYSPWSSKIYTLRQLPRK